MYKPFEYIPGYDYQKGWDKYALDYATLLKKGTIYYLTKELIHAIVDREMDSAAGEPLRVLDVNCGTGNDFPFFLERGWTVTGIDGSAGMLNKAAEIYAEEIKSKKIALFEGLIESINSEDFQGQRFDLIFSVTGGFSYVNDEQLLRINSQLAGLLNPDGKIIVAHLNRFCLPEFLYRMKSMKNPFLRKSAKLKVPIKGEIHTMYLRGVKSLRKAYQIHFQHLRCYPLLAHTPPYQTGFSPSLKTLESYRTRELRAISRPGKQIRGGSGGSGC